MVLTCQIPFMIELANSNRDWLRYEWIWQKTNPTGFLNSNRMPLKTHENILVFYDRLGTYNPQGIRKGQTKMPSSPTSSYGEYFKKIVKARENPNNYGDFYDNVSSGYVNYPRDVLVFPKDRNRHPTSKPVALFEYLIRTYTNEGETVLDNCMGSGTTAIACMRSNRHYIGFETSKEYYEMAMERIRNEQGDRPMMAVRKDARRCVTHRLRQ